MQILTPKEYKSFKTLAKMSQDQLHRTLFRILKNTYGEKLVQINENWVLAKGSIPIVLVAHMDTVFKDPPTEIFYDKEQNVIWSPQGLGADDRAGVFSILQIISKGYRPHIVFTTNEEWGCLGARRLAEIPCPFNDIRYVIELDRCNSMDCVFYECDNEEFEKYIEQFGFKYSIGSFSDICELCPIWEVAGVNLSVGYRDEHSAEEILFVSHMLNTIRKVENMLSNVPDQKFNFEWAYGSYKSRCAKCGKSGSVFMMTPVYDKDNHKLWYCSDCVTADNIEWCEECYEGFVPGILEDGICPNCKNNIRRFGYGSTNFTKRVPWD